MAAASRLHCRPACVESLCSSPSPPSRSSAAHRRIRRPPIRRRSRRAALTYYQDAAPIFASRCASCHSPGNIAPFSLLTYTDAMTYAPLIKPALVNHLMPPMPPDTSDASGCPQIDDARVMPDAERNALVAWVDGGALAGDAAHAAPTRRRADALGPPTATYDSGLDYDVVVPGRRRVPLLRHRSVADRDVQPHRHRRALDQSGDRAPHDRLRAAAARQSRRRRARRRRSAARLRVLRRRRLGGRHRSGRRRRRLAAASRSPTARARRCPPARATSCRSTTTSTTAAARTASRCRRGRRRVLTQVPHGLSTVNYTFDIPPGAVGVSATRWATSP